MEFLFPLLIMLLLLPPITFIVILIMSIRCYNLYKEQDKEWRPFLNIIILMCSVFLPFWCLWCFFLWDLVLTFLR